MRTNIAYVCAALAALSFAFLWQQLQATHLGYEVEAARSQLRSQRDKNAYLRLELARLHSPERLAKESQERLKMAPPSPECLVFLGSQVERREEQEFLSLLVKN